MINSHLKKIILIFNLLLVSGTVCANSMNECIARSDEEYKKLMLGKWVGTEELHIKGDIYFGETTYYKDGAFVGKSFSQKMPKKLADVMSGKWDVAKGIGYEFVVSTDPKELIKIFRNQVIADKIICMSRTKMITQASDGVRLEFNKK